MHYSFGNHSENDMHKTNILLYFPLYDSKVYIGVCDWDVTSKTTEVTLCIHLC